MTVEVWHSYSTDDENIWDVLLYKGDMEDARQYVKKYISNEQVKYPYYDKIFIVNNKNDLEYADEYIDMNECINVNKYIYKKNNNSCIKRCIYYLTCKNKII